MKSAEQIYEETKERLTKDNCQSLEVMALESIEAVMKEVYNTIYDLALENEEDNIDIIRFLDKNENKVKPY